MSKIDARFMKCFISATEQKLPNLRLCHVINSQNIPHFLLRTQHENQGLKNSATQGNEDFPCSATDQPLSQLGVIGACQRFLWYNIFKKRPQKDWWGGVSQTDGKGRRFCGFKAKKTDAQF